MMKINQRILWKKVRSMVLVGVGGTTAFGCMGIWSGNEKFYEQFLSPFLCRMDPETSHRAAVIATKYHLIRDKNRGDPDSLKTTIGPLSLTNPIGIAAGFDKSAECISGLARIGFGWIEIGSVTPLPQEGNPKPRVFRLPEDLAVINRYGFNNDGHEEVSKRVYSFKKEYPNYVVGVNLGANKTSNDRIEDYCKGIEVFSETADYFVINISSPNTPNLRDLQKNDNLVDLLKRVVKCRDSQTHKVPLFLKVAPDLLENDIKSICSIVLQKDTRVDGLIVSNTTISRETLKTQSEVRNETGGLSGKPLEKVSTELVGRFYKELKGEIPIIGVGGVCSGEDAFRKICSGASAVQLYTALTYKGPGIVERIKTELDTLLSDNGFKNISEAVGSNIKQKKTKSGKSKYCI